MFYPLPRIDSFERSGEVVQNGAGDGLTFVRWDEYGRRTVACGARAESWARSREEYGGLECVAGEGWLDG